MNCCRSRGLTFDTGSSGRRETAESRPTLMDATERVAFETAEALRMLRQQ